MRSHKSLIAWKRARAVVDGVLVASIHHWSPPAGAIFSQLQRSALSVQLNIAEGYARRTAAQFRFHLNVAYGSNIETLELLELLRDHSLVPLGLLEPMLAHATDCRGLLLGLLRRYSEARPPTSGS